MNIDGQYYTCENSDCENHDPDNTTWKFNCLNTTTASTSYSCEDLMLGTLMKSREKILGEIMVAAEPTVQFPRMMNCLNIYPTFALVLDNNNYGLARQIMLQAVTAEHITQDDYDLIDGILPPNAE